LKDGVSPQSTSPLLERAEIYHCFDMCYIGM
jgi:hypothetical protein